MLYSCEPSLQQKSRDRIQVLQRDTQLLHGSWVPYHNSPCRWRISPLQAMVYDHMQGGPSINLTSSNEHVPKIERLIRVVKYITRDFRHILPFNNIIKLLTIYIFFTVFRMLNYFQVKGVVSAILITKTIMSSETLHYKQCLGVNIGQCLQVHKHEDHSNSQVPRTKGAIFLGPSVN